jgi:hypothetical protein
LLRLDPHPDLDLSNPLAIEEDVVRFSFQRFQDHLIALALLDGSDAPGALFRPAGKLAFMLDEDCIVWSWRGVFYAACVVIAEESGVEVVDALPGGFETWWHEWGVQDAFIESIRWRAAHAFSARTLELLNKLGWDRSETISLLLELAVLEGHPWNAEFLHRNLKKRKLAPRDAFWTQPINEAEGDGSHPLWRLIDWCLGDGTQRAHDDILALAAKILAWAGSSTSWAIRDRSTKGLAAVLLARPALAVGLLQSFEDATIPTLSSASLLRFLEPACDLPSFRISGSSARWFGSIVSGAVNLRFIFCPGIMRAVLSNSRRRPGNWRLTSILTAAALPMRAKRRSSTSRRRVSPLGATVSVQARSSDRAIEVSPILVVTPLSRPCSPSQRFV